ncbi:MAG: methylated-DNA--[protein]-cysteine S-methyltransferase [Nitrososphaerales archaeon]|jgi:AraC family transcriptional regulator of adaptative response/methylated-DNA-[protein]-cysteine methyltransferase
MGEGGEAAAGVVSPAGRQDVAPDGREARLVAVMGRDGSFDGTFVFGVRSTGVYCRPSCPARRPRADRILLFPGPAAAEESGYRPCRRCRPTQAVRRAELVSSVCEHIQANLGEDLGLAALAKRFSVSPYHLQRVFKEFVGMSPRRYAEECRINGLKAQLSRGEPVVAALRRVGYSSQSWLYADSTAKLGMTPGAYRRGGAGMRIVYLVGDSPLGRLLVASTEHGICMVDLGESDEELAKALHREYPRATIEVSEEARGNYDAVLGYLVGRREKVPLDLRGTAFQRRVWTALQTIPEGSVCSYSDVAEMVGRPRAVRAVANACGKNPVPLIVPCHRVVRKDGGLGGYGLGLWRKRALLAEERRRKDAGLVEGRPPQAEDDAGSPPSVHP